MRRYPRATAWERRERASACGGRTSGLTLKDACQGYAPGAVPGAAQVAARRRLPPLGLQTTPGRIRALAAVAVLAIGGFYIVANIAVGNARDGLRVIGHDAGPLGPRHRRSVLRPWRHGLPGSQDPAHRPRAQSGRSPSRRSVATVRTVPSPTVPRCRPQNSPLVTLPTRQRCARSWMGSGQYGGSPAGRWSWTSRRITRPARHRPM